jgi:hypothetical protein
MPTVENSGTQTATIGTEHTLATISTAKTLVLYVDASAMVNGDRLELRAKTKILNGGTTRVAQKGVYQHAQPADDLIKFSVPIMSDQEAVFTLKQTAGTGRNFPWKVMSP